MTSKKLLNVSIIFPVYNEYKSIERVLVEWLKELNSHKHLRFEILICEDGSTDGTSEYLIKLKKKYHFSLNQTQYRRGYGNAVIDGINSAKYENILCVDSDGQCDPHDLSKFLSLYKNNILIGNRRNRADEHIRLIYSKLFGIYFMLLFGNQVKDPSAPYVFFRKRLILPYVKYFKLMKEGFWWGFVATCIKHNIKIDQIDINHRKRFDGKTQVYEPSKLISIVLRNGIGLLKIRCI